VSKSQIELLEVAIVPAMTIVGRNLAGSGCFVQHDCKKFKVP